MPYNPDRHHRRSVRLAGYDYSSPGSYFITICTVGRECLFGDIAEGRMVLGPYGDIVRDEWLRSAALRAEVALDAFVVMPNHLHGIVTIMDVGRRGRNVVGAHCRAPLHDPPQHGRAPLRRPPRSLGSFLAGFKAAATRRINSSRRTPGVPIWQRNYYEHIVRNDADLARIRRYVLDNPSRWAEDEYHP